MRFHRYVGGHNFDFDTDVVPGAGLSVANTETAAMPNGARHDVAPCDRNAISRSSGTKKPERSHDGRSGKRIPRRDPSPTVEGLQSEIPAKGSPRLESPIGDRETPRL